MESFVLGLIRTWVRAFKEGYLPRTHAGYRSRSESPSSETKNPLGEREYRGNWWGATWFIVAKVVVVQGVGSRPLETRDWSSNKRTQKKSWRQLVKTGKAVRRLTSSLMFHKSGNNQNGHLNICRELPSPTFVQCSWFNTWVDTLLYIWLNDLTRQGKEQEPTTVCSFV